MPIAETVWIYVDTKKQVGDVDKQKVFASKEAAEHWLAERDPEGVAFEYPVHPVNNRERAVTFARSACQPSAPKAKEGSAKCK
jgi:hypothetical protein